MQREHLAPASSLSTIRIAVDGFTPSISANAASLSGRQPSSTTSVRN